jgi:hypothetical protein
MIVGVARTSGNINTYNIFHTGRFASPTSLGTQADITLNPDPATAPMPGDRGKWFQLSFDLSFNSGDTTWTVTDLSLRDWGLDGETDNGVKISLASETYGSPGSLNLNTNPDAFVVATGWNSYFGEKMENIHITAIPEPASLVFMAIALTALGALHFCRRASVRS